MPKAASTKKSVLPVVKLPADWSKIYRAIAKMRRVLLAPVDVIGCDKLHDKTVDAETIRFQKLVALALSSQTRDQQTAQAMKTLIENVKPFDAKTLAKTTEATLAALLKGKSSFHNNKAKFLTKMAAQVVKNGGVVPATVAELVKLPGIGYKMASIFTECADGNVESIGVDTHMHRNFVRYGWAPAGSSPDQVMRAVMAWLPREYWRNLNEISVGFGQALCSARKPKCTHCLARHWCPASEVPKAQKALERKQGLADLEGDARELQDVEDLAALLAETKDTREELVREYSLPEKEQTWWWPTDHDEADGKPAQFTTEFRGPAEAAADNKKKKPAAKKAPAKK
jgi:endonuclease-3